VRCGKERNGKLEAAPCGWLSAAARTQRRSETGISSRHTLYYLLVCVIISGACASAQEPDLLPPSQSVAPAIVTADSGIKSSGTGKSWSKWYRLGVGKAPSGYTLQKADFWLTGDGSCGDFAECREVLRNDQQVAWEFRLQGHDEPDAPKAGFSEGHIRVITARGRFLCF